MKRLLKYNLMKMILLHIFLVLFIGLVNAKKLENTDIAVDSIDLYLQMADKYVFSKPDSTFILTDKAFSRIINENGISTKNKKANYYCLKGKYYTLKGNYKMAIDSYKEAINLYGLSGNNAEKARQTFNLGIVYSIISKNTEARNCFKEAEFFALNLKDTSFYSSILIFRGVLNYQLGNYEEAIMLYSNALDMKIKTGETFYIGIIYYHIGLLLEAQMKYDESYLFFSNALSIFKKQNNVFCESYCHEGIGNYYYETGKVEEAKKHYLIADSLHSAIQNFHGLASIALKTGKVYEQYGNYKLSIECYNKAHCIFKEIEYPKGEICSILSIAGIYKSQGRTAEAIDCLNKNLDKAIKVEDKLLLSKYYNSFSEIYTSMNNYKLAYEYYDKSISLKESVLTIEAANKLIEFLVRFEVEENNRELSRLEETEKNNEITLNKYNLVILILGCGIFVLIGVIIYVLIKRYQLSKK